MAKKTTKKKAVKFGGRILPSTSDFRTAVSDVLGPHHVLYPKFKADVATAVALSQNVKRFVRSGVQVATQDLVDGTGGIVIDLRELTKVSVEKNALKAYAAATTDVIAEQLAMKGLALPLTNNPLKSITSSVLKENASYLMRSLGSLSDYVTKIQAVNPNGKTVTIKRRAGASCMTQWEVSKPVIMEVEFKPTSSKGLWMFRTSCPYPGQDGFLDIARILFVKTKLAKLSPQADLVLEAYSGPHDIPLVRISAFGSTTKGKTSLKKLVEEALACVGDKFDEGDIGEEQCSGTEVLNAVADAGLGASLDPTISSESLEDRIGADEDLESFLVNHADRVHHGIAFAEKGGAKLNQALRSFSSLQVNRENGLEIAGHEYSSAVQKISTTLKRGAQLHEDARSAVRRISALVEGGERIPQFQGDIFTKDDLSYRLHAHQYATSSLPPSKMSPFMLAYPIDKKDIKTAIAFALKKNKRVVARSGGHQYTGKSSGGQDTIVLCMDHFADAAFPNGNIAEVGPAIRLTKLAKQFKQQEMTLPFGECPLVCVGGHAQTGGYGHLVRSFGLILDHVQSFDIVLANGTQRTVTRPGPNVTTTKANDELFWGVLGGNAGSFGIVTNYTFECVEDAKHPNSYGFSAVRRYKKDSYRKLMKETQKWTKKIKAGTMAPGRDFMMTVESSRITPFPILIVETVDANLGGKKQVVKGDQVFRSIISAASSDTSWWEKLMIGGRKEHLSDLAQSFVRDWPMTTLQGREFKYPYKKRVNCTMNALTDDFVDELVEMVNHVVINESGVKLVFQMLFGGGAYQNSKRRKDTSIPHRDYVYCFVFDLFYKNGQKDTAEALQQEMQQVIDNHFNQGQERKVFWGTFGDTNISNPAVRAMYYDDEDKYTRLQKLKKQVDPKDVFHTNLTVQLP